ncbi:MAG: cytochrome c-type biogenesis protein [Porticoccaceae bacterium]
MKRILLPLVFVGAYLFSFSLTSFAAIEAEDFSSEELRLRYQTLVDETRCPKCQNQNLAGSDSPISADLRGQIRRLLHEGSSDQEIADYLVARYGDYVLYRPRWQSSTYVLWLGPIILLLLAAAVVFTVVRRRRDDAVGEGDIDKKNALNAAEQAALDQVLDHSPISHSPIKNDRINNERSAS